MSLPSPTFFFFSLSKPPPISLLLPLLLLLLLPTFFLDKQPPLLLSSPPRATLQPEPAPSRTPEEEQQKTIQEPQTLTFQAAEVKFAQQDKEGLCAAQLAFLERKSKYAVGGPFMPPESICAVCGGSGRLRCIRCDGGGFNKGSGAEILGLDTSEDSVLISRNGRVDVNFYLAEGGICVLCRGTGECGCHLCEGSGFAGGITSKFCGD